MYVCFHFSPKTFCYGCSSLTPKLFNFKFIVVCFFFTFFEEVYNRFNEGDCSAAVCGSGATLAGTGDSGISAFAPENAVSISSLGFGQSSIPTEERVGTTYKSRNINYSKKKKEN